MSFARFGKEGPPGLWKLELLVAVGSLAAATFVTISSFLTKVTGPVSRDEVEFVHTAWLIASGQEIFRDFFQNHSPLYLRFLGAVAEEGASLDWIRPLRGLNVVLALGTAVLAARLATPRQAGLAVRAATFSLSLAFFVPLATFEIRAEGLSVAAFAAGWYALEASGVRRYPLRILAAAIPLGVSVALSPRALVPCATLLVMLGFARMAAAQKPAAQKAAACSAFASTLAAACVTVVLLTAAAPLAETWKWMLQFSRAGGPPSSLTVVISGEALARYWPACLIAGAILIGATARRPYPRLLFVPSVVLGAAWAAMFLEPRRFTQSLTFVALVSVVLYGRAAGELLRRAAIVPTPSSVWTETAAVCLALYVCARLFSMPTATVEGPATLEHLLPQFHPGRNLAESVRMRELICQKLASETVMVEPTEWHPICARDASYYWRGGEYLLDGTLQRAGIEEPPWDPAEELLRQPALVKLLPEVRDEVVRRRPEVESLLAAKYVPAGAYLLRRDLVGNSAAGAGR